MSGLPGRFWIAWLAAGLLGLSLSHGAAQPPHAAPADRITLNVKNTEITDVLRLLAHQRQLNIVASKDVSGPVSLNLYDVPFETALRAVLQVSGYTYTQHDGVIFVTKAPEKAAGTLRPVRLQTFRLSYANIAEVADMVQQVLSPWGKLVVGRESKTLLVEDTPETLAKVAELVRALDVKPRQVLIEAKILEVTLDRSSALGINWEALFGRNAFGEPLGDVFTQGFATSPFSGAPGIFFSVVDKDFRLLLSALQERGRLNTLANPKILTVDGKEAQILIGAKLGFRVTTTTQTSTLESVEFLDVGTELVITPTIGEDGYILMHVHPKVSDGVVEAGLPSETTTEATTSVLVKDGETLVIGGLIREREEDVRSQVPGLGNLPLLGALFRQQRTRKEKTEIVVLITPRLVREAPATAAAPPAPSALPPLVRLWDAEFVLALSRRL